VTSFFRDPAAFDGLATMALAPLVRGKDADATIRIWVPGCATGEEAYSIAILAAEQVAAAKAACRVQIFATDVDTHPLEVARGGVYPASIALDVSPQRLTRFFTASDHHYTIIKSIRESVVFAVQNVIDDPPFSKLDLVSCRNLLIYLEPLQAAQDETEALLRQRHHLQAAEDDDFSIRNLQELFAAQEASASVMAMMLAAVASVWCERSPAAWAQTGCRKRAHAS
jgi:chemotaxis methyl-accepting protein methylase